MSTEIKKKQLQILINDFELLAKTVLAQLQITKDVLIEKNSAEKIEEALANELIIDRLEVKIREEIAFVVFQFTPKAGDLRRVISCLEVVNNIERIGDMLMNIIYHINLSKFEDPSFRFIFKTIEKAFSNAGVMVQQSVLSFTTEDEGIAYKVLKDDDKVDRLYSRILLELQEHFENRPLTNTVFKDILAINTIAHNIERMGDCSTNIAESTIYLKEGKDIRHHEGS